MDTKLFIEKDLNREKKEKFTLAISLIEEIEKNNNLKLKERSLNIAEITKNLNLGFSSILASLLFLPYRNHLLSQNKIKEKFGEDVLNLIKGVYSIELVNQNLLAEQEAETLKKLLLALSKDLRVLLIKIAERLELIRNLDNYISSNEEKIKIAYEIRDIYASLANKLGLGVIKTEFENLSLKYSDPYGYDVVNRLREEKIKRHGNFLEKKKKEIEKILKDSGIKFTLQARVKSVSSIYRKLKKQKIPLSRVYDFYALRVIIDGNDKNMCYHVLGIIHNKWTPISERFRDFIAMPKKNNYQSLHTTVVGAEGIPFEIQIRTEEMHKIAEKGIAAHWAYKEGKEKIDKEEEEKVNWLRNIVEWMQSLESEKEQVQQVKMDIYEDEIFVFTPKGNVVNLPKGATVLDFAYYIHSDVGHHFKSAKVNGEIVPIKYALKLGDTVEIITSKDRHPNRDWLKYVKTPRARSKIKSYIKKEEEKLAIEEGFKILSDAAHRFKMNPQKILESKELEEYLKNQGIGKVETLLSKFFYKKVNPIELIENIFGLKKEKEEKEGETLHKKKKSHKIKVGGHDNILISLAKCCNPIKGEDIIGYISSTEGVKIHTTNCKNIATMNREKFVDAEWDEREGGGLYRAFIMIETEERKGITADITEKIKKLKCNITSIQGFSRDERGIFYLTIEVKDIDHLKKLISAINSMSSVKRVIRLRQDPFGGKRGKKGNR